MNKMTMGGELGTVRVVEWVPRGWWVVKITSPDGSFTPLEGPFKNKKQAEEAADGHEETERPRTQGEERLISDAAEAVEIFGDDELERAQREEAEPCSRS